ncbi:MAG TPA: hypothetical protein VEB64_17545 [Azospirillaceae bacterium]|nr:hypothetical protein [Azospirillaceae bacterium]
MKKRPLAIALGVVVALLLAETGTRLLKLGDYPLFDVDDGIGYLPSPNQAGAYLWAYDWVFNDRSMGTGAWKPTPGFNVFLIGDSIVYGGNFIRQSERIGSVMEAHFGGKVKVWPASAPSWALLNELEYIRRNEDIFDKIDAAVFVLNSADFGQPSRWASDLHNPRSKPLLLAPYTLEKYGFGKSLGELLSLSAPPPPAPSPAFNEDWPAAWTAQLKRFAGILNGPILVVFHPTTEELADAGSYEEKFSPARKALAALGIEHLTLLELRDEGIWNKGYYKDQIHPRAEGYRVIGDLIASALGKALDSRSPRVRPNR